jgi:3-methyladenine DNA glycosylase AlkC
MRRPPAPSEPPPRRTGATRRADIPPSLLARLSRGEEPTATLVEWMALDTGVLAGAVLPAALGARAAAPLVEQARALASAPVTRRTRGFGPPLALALAALPTPRRARAFEALATHRSDMVRSWAAYARACEASGDLPALLAGLKRFAADGHMAVRECAWDAWRPHVARDLARGIALLGPWVRDPDASVRRCAVEGTRPRGVWTAHIEALKADPSPGLALLEPVRADPSDYVRRAVANWVNDASKSRPDWARALARRWLDESPTPATRWIVRRGLRTLEKPSRPGRRAGGR